MKRCFLVLSYNHPELTRKCIQSLIDVSKNDGKVPIFLVHNGSETNHVERLKQQFIDIYHLVMPKNLGYSGGLNFGLQHCFKEFDRIIFVTNDVELTSLPEKWPENSGFYAPKIFFRKLDKIDSLGGLFIPHLAKLIHIKNEIDFEKILKKKRTNWKIPYVPGSAFVLDKEIYQQVGNVDESLHTYWEDVDFSARVYLQNLPMGLIKDLTFLHRVGKTCHQKPFYTTYLFQRNRRIVSFRYANFFYKPLLFTLWFFPFLRLLWKNYRSSPQKFSLLLNSLKKDIIRGEERR